MHVTSWHETYTGRIPQEILDGLDLARFTSVRERSLRGEVPGDEGDTWVAESRGHIVGFAVSCTPRDDPPPRSLELGAIYVLAAFHGTGVGTALLQAALGDAPASLWVLADNPRAQAFYRAHGFRPDGVEKHVGRPGRSIREIRMLRD